MVSSIKTETERAIRDLHARELLRLGWYRQWSNSPGIRTLRQRKAQHQAFLLELLRKRELNPAWYATLFYYSGHIFGLCTAILPLSLAKRIEKTLEFWILLRYEYYLQQVILNADIRSMIEAIQLRKLNHNEPNKDVINLLEKLVENQQQALG
ncbi:MAG: hypothetical protein LC115_02790 [Bacteroidia bacterium]|nr:hypothetical protein [Bacteroidia bacterium]